MVHGSCLKARGSRPRKFGAGSPRPRALAPNFQIFNISKFQISHIPKFQMSNFQKSKVIFPKAGYAHFQIFNILDPHICKHNICHTYSRELS